MANQQAWTIDFLVRNDPVTTSLDATWLQVHGLPHSGGNKSSRSITSSRDCRRAFALSEARSWSP